jgi:hypothetical protein
LAGCGFRNLFALEMTLQMSGLRFVISLALASIACLVYAGTAAALDGSTPVVAGVTVATTGSVTSGSVQVGARQLGATVAVSSDASDSGLSLKVEAAGAPASVGARVRVSAGTSAALNVAADSSSAVSPKASGRPVRPVDRRVAETSTSNRVEPHSRRLANPTRHEAPAARPTAAPLALQLEKPVVRPASHPSSGTVISAGSRLPGSAGAGFGGASGLAVAAILVAFVFLAARRCGRRLRPTAELARPPALLSALERPG